MTTADTEVHNYSRYQRGCRCDQCRAALAAYFRDFRRKRARTRDLVNATGSGGKNYVDGITHGYSGYLNYCCRCDICRAASSARTLDRRVERAAQVAADPTLVSHGKRSTYVNWGCRCAECKAAAAEYMAKLRARKASDAA